jgi:hypothetical protein
MEALKERVKTIEKSKSKGKKYVATTTKDRRINFGAIKPTGEPYAQYKDSTPLKLYKYKDHLDKDRRRRYFQRHSGEATKRLALQKEILKSSGMLNAKILSHRYLW